MTSEVAVMNQRAVALAADSAVTLVDGATTVVRNEQKKLFPLAGERPVAVMYYGAADIMGHPWDQVIAQYRHSRGGAPPAFLHLEDYARDFGAMLDDLPDFFSPARGDEEYRRLIATAYRHVFEVAQSLQAMLPPGDDPGDTRILTDAIARVWRDYQFREDGAPRPDLACFPRGFADRLARDSRDTIAELIALGFAPFGLGRAAVRQLRDIAVFAAVKDLFLEDVTGLVFAGYGAADRYPRLATLFVSTVVGGIVRRGAPSVDAIDGVTRSHVRVFADSEVTHAFLRGMDSGAERALQTGLVSVLDGFASEVLSTAGVSAAARARAEDHARAGLIPHAIETLRAGIARHQQDHSIDPMLRVLEIAGRDEMADTARGLVALNIFKKRLTAQKQTVGGAVDVAVLSREHGFQWHRATSRTGVDA